MPKLVPQELKTESTINAQPRRFTSKINVVMAMDIAGYTTTEIAEALGYTMSRVSLIKTSPLYTQQKDARKGELLNQVIEKKSTAIAENSVKTRLDRLAPDAVEVYDELLHNAKSELVKKTVADEILDRTGHKAAGEKSSITVQLTEKMAGRFERIMEMEDGSSESNGIAKVILTKEVSS